MTSHLQEFRLACLVLALGTCTGSVASQGMTHPSTTMVVRQQWGSIAQEVVDKLQLAPHSAIWLSIQPIADSVMAQNAFLDALQSHGYSPALSSLKGSGAVKLAVSVLTDRTQFKEVRPSAYERTIQTDIEARTERNNGENVEIVGMFHRVLIDTVSSKDVEFPYPRASLANEEQATLFQRLVGPLIVLASSIVIVYLFFTVRS